MIKHRFHGLIAVTLLSLLVATFAPAPLAAASRSLGSSMEQATNQGDDGQADQDNDDQNDDQNQSQQGQQQNQEQGGQEQQQSTTQAGCFAGTDQGSANFPNGCWTSLSAGGRHWYQFRYQGLSANRDDDDDDSSNSQPPTVDVRLKMETPGCISFWVMTQERLQNPDPDGDGIEEPVGAGTPIFSIDNSDEDRSNDDNSNDDSDDNDDDSRQSNPDNNDNNNNRDQSVLNWQGAANANITFYVIVRNNRDFSCSYSLSIEGAGVPVPGQQAQPNQGQQNQDPQQQQGSQGNNGSANNNDDNNNDDNGNNNDDNGSEAQG